MKKLICFFMLLAGVCLAQPPDGDPAWQLILNEDFNGNSVNAGIWDVEDHSDNFSTTSKCVSLARNVAVSNGKLIVTTNKESYSCPPAYMIYPWDCNQASYDYTSGSINTNNSGGYHFGYYEARIRMDFAKGHWPSFWLINYQGSPKYSEIDIFEMVGMSNEILGFTGNTMVEQSPWNGISGVPMNNYIMTSNVHCVGNPNQNLIDGGNQFPATTFVADYTQWHTYGFEWQAGRMVWYVDGVMVRHIKTPPGFDNTISMSIVLGSAVSSGVEKDPNKSCSPCIYPALMEVDYVRYYKLSGTCSPDINVTCYNFASHDSYAKGYYEIGASCYNTVPNNQPYIFRAGDHITLKDEFSVPLGAEALFDVDDYCDDGQRLAATTECGQVMNPCNFNFSYYNNSTKSIIELCGPGSCSAIVQPVDNVLLHAQEHIRLAEGFEVPLNSELEVKIVSCP